MTGNELLNTTLKMLGYSDANGNTQLTQRIRNRAVVAINLVYADLWRICKDTPFSPIKSIGEEIDLPDEALYDVFPYGLAMHIAQSESDGDQQQFYAAMFNRKRLSLSRQAQVKDVIPRCYDG